MTRWARELEARLLLNRPAPADRYWADPARLLSDAGYGPDPWQAEALRCDDPRILLCCSRQSGKTTVAAALVLREALLIPDSLVLLLSPSLRQSSEALRRVLGLYNALGRPVPVKQESALSLTLTNGSRVVSLPGEEGTVRGFSSVRLLVIDEAARVSDELYRSVRPMLAVSGGKLLALSSAWAKAGWYWEAWSGSERWRRFEVTASQCPRIDPAFLEQERATLGIFFDVEYGCQFLAGVASMFRPQDIAAMTDNDLEPLDLGGRP